MNKSNECFHGHHDDCQPCECDCHTSRAVRIRQVLILSEAHMRLLGRELSSPRFTDRHGDGPELLRLADLAHEALGGEKL